MQAKNDNISSAQMKSAIAGIYTQMTRPMKGKFINVLTIQGLGTKGTWRHRLSAWVAGKDFPCNILVLREAYSIAISGNWTSEPNV